MVCHITSGWNSYIFPMETEDSVQTQIKVWMKIFIVDWLFPFRKFPGHNFLFFISLYFGLMLGLGRQIKNIKDTEKKNLGVDVWVA